MKKSILYVREFISLIVILALSPIIALIIGFIEIFMIFKGIWNDAIEEFKNKLGENK